ncbi:MAG TPA: response regulator [Deltaproteobacteria bacterium]|nr:response regulator [Deltaproteobacteria bacterium]
MNKLIAVIDDEPDIRHLVTLHLKKEGFEVNSYSNSSDFLKSIVSRTPDLIILDLMLPDLDGLSVCRQLKKDADYSDIPIIMLTAKVLETDKVAGLDLGADDYVTKPFSPRELMARVKAVLRRTDSSADSTLCIGDSLTIDPERFLITVKNEPVNATSVEFRILHLLAMNRGRVFSREKILDHLWGNEKAVLDRTVDVHIKNLRDKLGVAGNMIRNIRGVGYKLEE